MLKLVVLALLAVPLSGCADDCANRVVGRARSPDGRHAAVMFERNCGATTGSTTQISLLAPEAEPADGGNLFIADADHGAAATGDWGGPWASAKWIDGSHLLILYASGSRIFQRSTHASGVTIRYQAVER